MLCLFIQFESRPIVPISERQGAKVFVIVCSGRAVLVETVSNL